MNFLVQASFFFFLVSFVKAQAAFEDKLYACMLFCSNGKRIFSSNCYQQEDECGLSLSLQAGECSDLKNLQIFAIPFQSSDPSACKLFIDNLLVSGQNDKSLQTKEQIGDASCGCTDLVNLFLKSISEEAIKEADYCNSITKIFLLKVQLSQLKCGETKTNSNGLKGKFCSFVLDKTGNAFSMSSLKSLCGFVFDTLKKAVENGNNLEYIYQQIKNNPDIFLEKTSNIVCGMLLCSSAEISGVCQKEPLSNKLGIVAKLVSTTSKTYCSVTESTEVASSENVFGCLVFCSNGKRVISSGCYASEKECSQTLAAPMHALGQECSDLEKFIIYFFIFPKTKSSSCSSFISDFLMGSQNNPSLQTKEQIGEASCGCTNMISSMISSITTDNLSTDGVCSTIVDHLIAKFPITNFICGKNKLLGLIGKFCSFVIDSTAGKLVQSGLTTLCEFLLKVIKQVTGLDLNKFYEKITSKLLNEAESLVNKTSNAVCGMMLCSSTSMEGCKEEKYSTGIIASVASTAVGIYCKSERLLYIIWLAFLCFIAISV